MQWLFLKVNFLLLVSFVHPLHVSVTDVAYNADTGSLEIIHKVFIDDFQQAVEMNTGTNIRLGTEQEHAEADKFINQYMQQHFSIQLNGKAAEMEYVGREIDFEAIWIYQEIKQVADFDELTINDAVLLHLYDDQKNILHLDYKQEKTSFMFQKGKTEESYQYKKQ